MRTTKMFPTKAYGDCIIIDRLQIKDIQSKKAANSKIIIGEAAPPKNLLELEKLKLEEHVMYNEAEKKMLSKWDEHPNQGIVVSVGPGRDLGNGVILTPKIKVGDHILYRGNAGEPMVINKKLYWMIKDHDIFSTVPAADLIK